MSALISPGVFLQEKDIDFVPSSVVFKKGRRAGRSIATGYVFAPYVPMLVTPIIGFFPDDIAKKIFEDPIDQLMYDIGYEVTPA